MKPINQYLPLFWSRLGVTCAQRKCLDVHRRLRRYAKSTGRNINTFGDGNIFHPHLSGVFANFGGAYGHASRVSVSFPSNRVSRISGPFIPPIFTTQRSLPPGALRKARGPEVQAGLGGAT